MRILTTESGACYEVLGDLIRRTEGGDGNTKRRDGSWVRLLAPLPDEDLTGVRLFLQLESLAAYGPDDYGTSDPHPGVTTRVTTPVTSDDWIPV